MLLLGHVGLTLGLARVLSHDIDVRWIAVVSILPDLIDKPLRYWLAPAFTQGNTRTVGHSLTMLVLCLVGVYLGRRHIRAAWVVALLLPVHIILDGMWWFPELRVSLLWPWAGHAFPPLEEVGMQGLLAHIQRNLSNPLNLIGEVAGFLLLRHVGRRHGITSLAAWVQVWRTGRLRPDYKPPPSGSSSVGSGVPV